MMRSRIKEIYDGEQTTGSASTGESVSMTLEDPIDISRGDMIVRAGMIPHSGKEISLMICWFNEKALKTGGRYLVRSHAWESKAVVKKVNYRMNMHSLERDYTVLSTKMNDISNVTIHTPMPFFYDSYAENLTTGSLIFIDEGTNETVAAGMII